MINTTKLSNELRAAGITTHGNCNSNGVVWDDDNNEIQKRADVKAILAAHDPTPLPPPPTLEEQIAELKAQNALLIKAVDKSKLTAAEVTELTKVEAAK
jgi:hypothetical protein